jgi:hypothetical protein
VTAEDLSRFRRILDRDVILSGEARRVIKQLIEEVDRMTVEKDRVVQLTEDSIRLALENSKLKADNQQLTNVLTEVSSAMQPFAGKKLKPDEQLVLTAAEVNPLTDLAKEASDVLNNVSVQSAHEPPPLPEPPAAPVQEAGGKGGPDAQVSTPPPPV